MRDYFGKLRKPSWRSCGPQMGNASRIGGSFLKWQYPRAGVFSFPEQKNPLGLGWVSTGPKYCISVWLPRFFGEKKHNVWYDYERKTDCSFKLQLAGFPTSHGTFGGAVNITKNPAMFSPLLYVFKKDSFLFCFSLSTVFSRHRFHGGNSGRQRQKPPLVCCVKTQPITHGLPH